MDYNPINIALKGEPQGEYFEPTLGPYDYWAIEYAYKPLPKETRSDELAKIAARGAASRSSPSRPTRRRSPGIDPDANQFDLGSDPLVYLRSGSRSRASSGSACRRSKLKPGETYDVLRRSFDAGFRQVDALRRARSAKYVGGVDYVRDYAGHRAPAASRRCPPAKQRAALKLARRRLFSADSFRFKPEFLRSMGVDYLDIGVDGTATPFNPDFSLRTRVLALQRDAARPAHERRRAARMLDSEIKVGRCRAGVHASPSSTPRCTARSGAS